MTKFWKMKMGRIGDIIEVKVPVEPNDVLTDVLGKVWNKLIADGKNPHDYVPISDPEQIEE